MSTLIDIQTQIEKLQKQANEIKSKDFHATVQDILAKMAAFGITVKDLQSGKGKSKAGRAVKGKTGAAKSVKAPKAARKASNPVAPKYRGPHGETWTGRGLTPKWLSTLVAQGQSKDSFLISA
jgi:DNA-binding protein H-NS